MWQTQWMFMCDIDCRKSPKGFQHKALSDTVEVNIKFVCLK